MLSFLQRHKRRVLGVAAAAVAGGAAYYVYSRWLEWAAEEEDDAKAALRAPPRPPPSSTAHPARGVTEADPAGADQRLTEHFASLQHIARRTALPEFLPGLRAALATETALDELVDSLRGGQLSREQKVATWDTLKLESFAFVLGAAWAVALLEVFLRLQLSILGRLLYAESAAAEPAATGSRHRAPATAMPPGCQRDYLQHAQAAVTAGLGPLLDTLRGCLEPSLQRMPLTTPCSSEELLEVLSDAQQAFAAAGTRHLWSGILFPAPTASGSSLGPEGSVLGDMLAEARVVVDSPQFDAAVTACAASTSRRLAAILSERVGAAQARGGAAPADGLPLAKLIPVVSAAGRQLLEAPPPEEEDEAKLAQLPAVQRLCSDAYSSGPPL